MKKWIITGAVGLLVLVVGVPLLYTKVIAGDAPEPLALDSATGASSSTNTGPNGTWKVSSGSIVGYRVKEVLFGQSNTAVGRTSDVSGQIEVDGTTITSGVFTADMTTVRSDQQRRDNQFNGRIMETSRYPTASFKITKAVDLGTVPADGAERSFSVHGEVTLHGTTKQVDVELKGVKNGSRIQVTGSIPIVFADYEIGDPSFGPVTTEDHGVLEFSLFFTHA